VAKFSQAVDYKLDISHDSCTKKKLNLKSLQKLQKLLSFSYYYISKCPANVFILETYITITKNKNTNNRVLMKLKYAPFLLISTFFLTLFCSCKKSQEEKNTIPEVYWASPEINKELTAGSEVYVTLWCTFSSKINSITVSLISPESDLNKELYSKQINSLISKVDFKFVIDSGIQESKLQLNASIITGAGVNNFKRDIRIAGNSDNTSFGLVKILKKEFGKFTLQQLSSNLLNINSSRTYNHEFESSISINQKIFISTKKTGGLIEINSNLEEQTLLENKFGADPFIRSMAEYSSSVYAAISNPSNQIIGFNSSGRETVRAGLQLDVSEEILIIDDLIYSIERSTNGGSFIIANYNLRTGGYISNQNLPRLIQEPHLFDFENKNQVYFYHNVNGQVQIERLSQSENNVSIIDNITGICIDQKPLRISNSEVIIPLERVLYLFTKDHLKSKLFSLNDKIKVVKLNASKDRLAILTQTSLILLNYPTLEEISRTSAIEDIVDIQFLD